MLSDACSDFLSEFEESARKLAEAVHWYSSPSFGAVYGEEIDALRRACVRVAEDAQDVGARVNLLRLAASVMKFHDTPPVAKDRAEREAQMLALVDLLRQSGIDGSTAKVIVANLGRDDAEGEAAATHVGAVLKRLGTSAYVIAVKIIKDIGSATVKKVLGL